MSTEKNNLNFNQIDVLESQVLSKFNEGYKTFEDLLSNVQFSEQVLTGVITNLISKNVFRLNTFNKEYEYTKPLEEETIILDGNFMLPTTIIRKDDCLLVTRGSWYKFDKDFDVRRIIWNVTLPDNKNSTLVNLIKESALKVRKIKNVQVPEYQKLVHLIIPYNKKIKFELICVGEEKTNISLMMLDTLKLDDVSDDFYEFRKFSVRTEIDTDDLISQLSVDVSQRNFESIKVGNIYNFSEFIFKDNCLPISNDGKSIEYVKIEGIKNMIKLSYYKIDNTLKEKKLDTEMYSNISEGIEKLRTIFKNYCEPLLSKKDIMIEYE